MGTREEQLWQYVAETNTPGFFLTADILHTGNTLPRPALEHFIHTKLTAIRQGASGRKFTFREGDWHIHLTFFPTDHVVDERYAMKNKMIKNKHLPQRDCLDKDSPDADVG